MKSILFLIGILYVIQSSGAEEVRLVDLEPPDAQQLIEKQDQSLHYAPKVDSNVPAVRYLGNEPHDVQEDIYLARQYHGQDGLGGYLYGYNIPDIAKTEKKVAGGDLRGAYNYIAQDGQEIKVEYWDDGTGFHQIDNVPKILPKQIEDSPEVKAEKEKFLTRWQEEAERNQHPVTSPYDSNGNYASGPLSLQGQLEFKKQSSQYPQGPGSGIYQQARQYQPSNQYQSGQYGQQRGSYNQPGQYQSGGQYRGAQTSSHSQGQYQQPGQYQSGGQYQGSQSYDYSQGHYNQPSQSSGSQSYDYSQGQHQKPGQTQSGGSQSYDYSQGQYQKPGQTQSVGSESYDYSQGQYQKPGQTQSGGSQSYDYSQGQYQKPGQTQSGGSQSYDYSQGQYQKPGQTQSVGSESYDYSQGQYQKPGQTQSVGSESYDYSQGQYQKPGQYQSAGQYQGSPSPSHQPPGPYQSSQSGQYQQPGQYQHPTHQSGQSDQPINQIDYSGQFSENKNVYSTPNNQPNKPGQYNSHSSQSQYSQNGLYQQGGNEYSNSNQVDKSGQYDKKYEEENGPPKGFFYSFDYPVGKIVSVGGISRTADVKNIYNENKSKYESELHAGQSASGGTQSGYAYTQ